MAELAEQITQFKSELTTALTGFKDEVKDEIELLKKAADQAQTKSDLSNLKEQVERIRAELIKAESKSGERQPESIAENVWESAALKDLRDRFHAGILGRAVVSKEFSLSDPSAEIKTDITTGTIGRSTPGILVPERVGGIVPLARRELRLRDVLPVGPCSGDAIEFIRESAFTNAASPQTEASSKAESALTFAIAHEHVHLIATFIPATRQALDDFGELQRYINDTLLYGLKLKEETEILSGDNLGDHLNGLITQATSYAGTYVAASDTKIDLLNHAITEMEARNEQPNFVVLNPIDWRSIVGTKTNEGGANLGVYIVGNPGGPYMQVPTVWGLPVVRSNSMTSGKFLMGDSRMAKIFDRMSARIDISTEHASFFIQNMVAIRAEERIALAVFRTAAFTYGSF